MRIANVPKLIKITPEGEDMLLSYCTRILFLLFTFCLSFKLIYLFRIHFFFNFFFYEMFLNFKTILPLSLLQEFTSFFCSLKETCGAV